MTQIIQLTGKYACQECGSFVSPYDKKCGVCKKEFNEGLKVIEVDKLRREQKMPYKSRFNIMRDKVRNNKTLVVEDFVSVWKLKELKRISLP
ncbi:MAG: hypothetical protein HYS98_02145 [Deltaproteobacteria bacterium]|nr:hypothetical protein [Deltaproteobacteria bacterium]